MAFPDTECFSAAWFSAAVCPDNAGKFAFVHRKRHPVHDFLMSVTAMQVVDGQQMLGHPLPPLDIVTENENEKRHADNGGQNADGDFGRSHKAAQIVDDEQVSRADEH